MAVELKIKIKTEDSTHTIKELVYEDFCLAYDDPIVEKYIKKAKEKLNIDEIEYEDIVITGKLQVK